VSITDIYILPTSIRVDIAQLSEYEELDPKDIMRMIRERYTGTVTFTVADLREYISIMNERKNMEIILAPSPSVVNDTGGNIIGEDRQMDNSPMADFRNSRAIMDMFKQDIVTGFTTLKRLKSDAYARDQVLTDLEAIALKYIQVGGDLMEKEGKLKLDMAESNKNLEYVREEIRKMLMLVKGILKRELKEQKYRDVIEALASGLELYKFKI